MALGAALYVIYKLIATPLKWTGYFIWYIAAAPISIPVYFYRRRNK